MNKRTGGSTITAEEKAEEEEAPFRHVHTILDKQFKFASLAGKLARNFLINVTEI